MELRSADRQEWAAAPDEHFTGRVWFGPMAEPRQPEDMAVLGVMFEPGARTDWHSHPGGQVLYIVGGNGRVQNAAGDTVAVSAGDTVYAPPGEVHWHGATPGAPMIHLSITAGGPTAWEPRKVSDEDYYAAR